MTRRIDESLIWLIEEARNALKANGPMPFGAVLLPNDNETRRIVVKQQAQNSSQEVDAGMQGQGWNGWYHSHTPCQDRACAEAGTSQVLKNMIINNSLRGKIEWDALFIQTWNSMHMIMCTGAICWSGGVLSFENHLWMLFTTTSHSSSLRRKIS